MIIIIAKKNIDGRWADIDGTELYSLDQIVEFANDTFYKVTSIVGSRITLELVANPNE